MRKSNQIETKTTQNIEKLNTIVPKILSRLEMAIVEDLWPPQGSRKIHIVHVESPSEIFVRDEILEDKWSQREEDFKRVRFNCFYLPKIKLRFWLEVSLSPMRNLFFHLTLLGVSKQ